MTYQQARTEIAKLRRERTLLLAELERWAPVVQAAIEACRGGSLDPLQSAVNTLEAKP